MAISPLAYGAIAIGKHCGSGLPVVKVLREACAAISEELCFAACGPLVALRTTGGVEVIGAVVRSKRWTCTHTKLTPISRYIAQSV